MVEQKSLRYRNITISGLPGAGSSTLGKGLKKILDWEYFAGGDFMRQYAVKQGLFDKGVPLHHGAAVYGDEFDKKVDYGMRQSLQEEEGRILDAWLSGFMAQEIKGVLKVLVFCSNDGIRVDRIVNRDRVGVEEAKEHVFTRERENLSKWSRMYKKEWEKWVPKSLQSARRGEWLDFYHPDLYDLAIDTYAYDREASLKQVLDKMGFKET